MRIDDLSPTQIMTTYDGRGDAMASGAGSSLLLSGASQPEGRTPDPELATKVERLGGRRTQASMTHGRTSNGSGGGRSSVNGVGGRGRSDLGDYQEMQNLTADQRLQSAEQELSAGERTSNWRETFTKGMSENEETVIDLVDGIFDDRKKVKKPAPVPHYRPLIKAKPK